jgi:hypothetical protein
MANSQNSPQLKGMLNNKVKQIKLDSQSQASLNATIYPFPLSLVSDLCSGR